MEEFSYIILPETINLLPLAAFEGEIHLIDDPEKAKKALKTLLNQPIIGFDTESRPSFKKGQNFPISLIQISTLTDAYIFQIKKTGITDEMLTLLGSPSIIKVGLGLQHELSEFRQKGIDCDGFADLEKIAGSHRFKQRGIRALAAFFLNIRISKSAQKSNWSKPNLTEAQILYAATDAWVCLRIYTEMQNRGFISEEHSIHIYSNFIDKSKAHTE